MFFLFNNNIHISALKNSKAACYYSPQKNVSKSEKTESNLQKTQNSRFTYDSSCSSSEAENAEDKAFIDDAEINDDVSKVLSSVVEFFQNTEQPKNSKR